MINTEVKKLGDNEYALHVHISKEQYDEVYANHLKQMQENASSAEEPNDNILEGDLGPVYADRLFEMTVSELIKNHYGEAIELSGVIPALEPAFDVPEDQGDEGLEFIMNCVTWPKMELADLSSVDITRIDINVTDEDIQSFIGHLMESEVRYEMSGDRTAQNGDQVVINYEGFIDDVAFEGGTAENTELMLGQNQFIPGFEEGLIGAKAGDERSLEISFPEEYQTPDLAGKEAVFKVQVLSVAEGIRAKNQDELAQMLEYESAAELEDEVVHTLAMDAERVAFEATKTSTVEALLAVHNATFPDRMIEQEMENSTHQMRESMKQQGMAFDESWLEEDGFKDAIRRRSEKWLTQALIFRAIHENADLNVSDKELEEELDRLSREDPEREGDEFKRWMREHDGRISAVVDDLLEKKCILHALSQANVSQQVMSLAEWKETQTQHDSRVH